MRRTSSLVVLLALSLCACAAGGCGTTVRPQVKPIDPVPVLLADYGVHSSLMLPTPDGRYVEYSFGDFGYAALNRGGPHNALGALFASGESGLGRRFLTVRPGDETPKPAYAPKAMQKFYANRFQVYALVKELDLRYRRGADDPVHNPVTDNVFVKDSERYSFANNCNHMTARMLEQLGCEVQGNRGTSSFKVVGKQQLPPAIDTSSTYVRTRAPQSSVRETRTATASPKPNRESRAIRAASYTRVDPVETN